MSAPRKSWVQASADVDAAARAFASAMGGVLGLDVIDRKLGERTPPKLIAYLSFIVPIRVTRYKTFTVTAGERMVCTYEACIRSWVYRARIRSTRSTSAPARP